MKFSGFLFLLVFSLSSWSQAQSFTCYELRLAVPADLKGTGAKDFLTAHKSLCVREQNLVRQGSSNIYTGQIVISLRDGDFVMKGYALGARSTQSSLQNATVTYAEDVAGLTGESSGRIRLSLNRNAGGVGANLGQISIAGAVFGLFGKAP